MRTTSLLVASAALALSLATSKAQPYTANIVGYANVVLHGNAPGTPQYTCVANPFDNGAGNYMTNILSTALPPGSQVLTWTGINFHTDTKTAGIWSGTALTLQLPPGTGFFVRNGRTQDAAGADPDITNTFVGSVIVNVGASVTNAVPLAYTLQGSPIPYAGNLAIAGTPNGDPNMDFGGPLTKAAQILTWVPGTQAFHTTTKTGGVSWNNGGAAVAVGEGFFINNVSGPATNVVETLAP